MAKVIPKAGEGVGAVEAPGVFYFIIINMTKQEGY